MEALLTCRLSPKGDRVSAKGDRVSALSGCNPRNCSSFDPAMVGSKAFDSPRGMPRPGSFTPEMVGAACDGPRGMKRSGSADPSTMALPSVSLSFLKDEGCHTSSPSSPTGLSSRKMQPLSAQRQAAIEKCIRAIEECKSVLVQSGQGECLTEDEPLNDDGLLDERPPRAGRAQGGSPRVVGSPRFGSPRVGSPRLSPRPGSPRVFRKTPYRSGSPAPYPEEDVWAWLDGMADEPPAHRTLTPRPSGGDHTPRSSGGHHTPRSPVPAIAYPPVSRDASRSLEECGRLSAPPQDERLCVKLGTSSPRAAPPSSSSPRAPPPDGSYTEALRDVTEAVACEQCGSHAVGGACAGGGAHSGGGGPRVFRTTPYIRRGSAPIVSPSP